MIEFKNIFYIFIIMSLIGCWQKQIKTPINSMDQFKAFKKKEKFAQETAIFYPGISDPALRSILTEKINLAADDFIKIAKTGEASDIIYQDKIQDGLERFSDVYINLDTEDRERVCHYFEELMDIVGLKSSGGHLNEFMYGFNPSK